MKVAMPEKTNREQTVGRSLSIGDVVRLNSGGPLMTVSDIKESGEAACLGNSAKNGIFTLSVYLAALTVVSVNHDQLACWVCAVGIEEGEVLLAAEDGNFYCGDCHPLNSEEG